MQKTISTSLRAGFDYVWGTPKWRVATVVKRRVTWVKTKNRGFTVTLQWVSIQVSTGFPGYEATCSQFRRCDTYKWIRSVQLSSVGSMVFPCYILNGKHFSVRLSPHPLLIPEARSKRKQIMFVHTWNMLTATFTLTSCCKMSSLFSTGSFFNQWLFISGLVVIFGRPCWLVIKILSLWGKKDESPLLLKRTLIHLF